MKAISYKEGFTLIELMVVIVVIAILVAIAVPVYNISQDNAKEKACYSNQKIINQASNQWHLAIGTPLQPYPLNVQQLINDEYITDIPTCSGNTFTVIDSATGLTECPKPTDKHILH
jgi:prepilin-type N-terminal cleavage/methylation domain-containing protein